MNRHTPFYELQVALGDHGCAICTLVVRALERYFGGLVYEKINDTRLRDTIRRSYGFCAAHGAMLQAARSALGIAIVQRDVLRAAASALAAGSATGQQRPGLREALFGARQPEIALQLAPRAPCPACQLAGETTDYYADLLVEHYSDLRPQFQSSAGLCLDHLRVTLARPAATSIAELCDDQLAIWASLEAELDTFIRKHDHQFANEPVGPEGDAWSRVTNLLAGDWRVAVKRRT